jgi:AraC-like DNA-binding protein
MTIPYSIIHPLQKQFPGKSATLDMLWQDTGPNPDRHLVDVDLLFEIIDELDESIGLHWPIVATSLWKPISQPLFSAYFATSKDLISGFLPIMSENALYLPFMKPNIHPGTDGVYVSVLMEGVENIRHYEVFHIIITLTFHSICKTIPIEGSDGVRTSFGFAEKPFHSVLRGLMMGEVEFGATESGAFYPNDMLFAPLRGYRPDLNKSLLDEILMHNAAPKMGETTELVRKALLRQSAFGKSLAELCEGISISPRTLQRKLKSEGQTYADIRDAVLEERLLALLRNGVPESEIVNLLGFSSRSTLNDNCKRLFSTSLKKMRNGR